ncbi:peptidyl-prolyl cis-trans isomerase [Flavihumibacter petaseus]|uniref:peptidylprolyl isomerase n=1 Tax=Flavihumibacter petaseus NBRC 106054 TaxID=1220578 RepID=A0A0E9N059_9BACT|nr:peptidylprolyl isomerase [Flavihumibacter petaseus]GAO42755.1 hypothetical protein FPE01S_01_17730 [Flavihumibacter petaseus NBRC 106054]
MKKILSEPLFQFFILGVILYVSVTFIRSRTESASREIDISRERVASLITGYQTQLGVLPTNQQLEDLINAYIREEITYREAKKLGLDKDDEIVRRRLSQKFEFLQSDLEEIPSPTEEQLQAFYKNNPELFSAETTVTFSHIYFNSDNRPDTIVRRQALTVLQELTTSGKQRAPEKGDRFPLQYDYTDQSLVDIKSNFGDKPIADSLFKGKTGTWLGPVQSGYGWHLVYISNRNEHTLLPYEAVKEAVKTKYLEAEKEKQNRQAFEQLSKKYIIRRNYLEEK